MKTLNGMEIYIGCTYSAGSTEFRKGGTAGKRGRHGGGEPASCFGAIHEHRVA